MFIKNTFLRGISFVFHPLIMPLLGVLFYFSKTPRFIPEPIVVTKLFSTAILTVVLPILLFFLLKTINKVETIYIKQTKERIIPLLINSVIISLIIRRVFTQDEIIELFYFFVGILCSTIICLCLAIYKVKASIHMIAASGFFMFAIGLALHFKININGTIALMMVILGAVATSRLHLKAHTPLELILGTLTGSLPQLALLYLWL